MASSIELAARLSGVVSVQQDVLGVINDPDKVVKVIVSRTPELTNGSASTLEMAGKIMPDDVSAQCLAERRAIRCDDVENEDYENVRSFIVAPLMDGNSAIGVLRSTSTKPNAFDDLDTYTLQLLAGMASSALISAHEFREHQASEQRYRLLFERNIAGVFRTTLDGRFLDCNDALATYLGYNSREDLLKRESWDLYHERADREKFLSELQRNRGLTNLRLRLKKKDGTSIIGVVNASMVPAEEGETHLLGTFVEA